MNNLTTGQMIGIGVGGVVVLAGIGGVVYKKNVDREAAERKRLAAKNTAVDGSLPDTFGMPLLRSALLSGLHIGDANLLSVVTPNSINRTIVKGLELNIPIMGKKEFAVGYHSKVYPGYRMATATDWTNPAFQATLMQAHREGGGWALLEEPLVCNNGLWVAEGYVQIDGALVVEVGFDNPPNAQQLRGVYPAMNWTTEVAWTTTAPALGNNWSIWALDVKKYIKKYISSPPCLFVHKSYDAAAPGGGSRRSRRHKWSKRARKQKKKGTKKH
jgi:hypothetical protein